MSNQPKDGDGAAIPVLRFRLNGSQVISNLDSVTPKLSSAFDNNNISVVTITSTTPIFFATGNADVVASNTSHYLPGGMMVDFALGSEKSDRNNYHTHISCLAASANAEVYISERD